MSKKRSLRGNYHQLIEMEFDLYKRGQSFSNVFLTKEDFANANISENSVNELVERGFLLNLENGRYRTLHMDLAFRASDIRVKHKGTRYILENNLKVVPRPLLNKDYMVFEEGNEKFDHLYSIVNSKLGGDKLTKAFFLGLKGYGINGLSKYQYDSILKILTNSDDAVISAPTGFGKTYVFLLPILVEIIKAVKDGISGIKAVLFYPRNALGSDQMNRLVKILYHINQKTRETLRIGIDIGPTRDLEEGSEFLGVKCPEHGEHLIIKNGRAYCPKRHFINFIETTRQQIRSNPPDILVSNIWAWQYRLVDDRHWNIGYLGDNIRYFVFDEVHAYRGIVAGVLRYFIRILQEVVSSEAKVFFSSATIPALNKFTKDIMGESAENILHLEYKPEVHGRDVKKLELYLLVGVNPYTSWETYVHELAIYLSTVNRLRKNKNLQSLVFVDSIRNINRLRSQTREAVDLGDPKDHLDESIPSTDPYCYWIYNPQEYKFKSSKLNSPAVNMLRSEIIDNVEHHYSYRSDRYDIEDDIREGNIDVVYSTSTLELGVDYDTASVVVNAGIPFSLESIVQRVGRAGRFEESTLNTSLSIIVVRNNPLEYFHLYKGIDSLTNVKEMPPIPVSHDNHFVIFYSALLYVSALLTSDGHPVQGKVNDVRKILDYFKDNQLEILEILGTHEDIEKIEEDVNQIINILEKEDMEKVRVDVLNYIQRKWSYRRLKRISQEVRSLIESLYGEVDDTPARDQKEIRKHLDTLSETINKVKEFQDFEKVSSILLEITQHLDGIKNRIRSINYPLFSYRSEIWRIEKEIESNIDDMSKIRETPTSLDQFEGESDVYVRAFEVYNEVRDTNLLIQFIESLMGFKHMGNEFIDREVRIGAEHGLSSSKTEPLSNVITRMPPFEIQSIPFESREGRKITELVGGRYAWFVKPHRYYMLSENADAWEIKNSMKDSGLGLGRSTSYPRLFVPEEIIFVDFLSREPFTIKIWCKGEGKKTPLYIKYGSEKIVNEQVHGKYPVKNNICELGARDPQENVFTRILEGTTKKLQSLNEFLKRSGNSWGANLDYISACRLGFAISTDPFTFRCPSEIQGDCRVCDGKEYWHSYRKMFPKVYLNKRVQNIPSYEPPLMLSFETTTYDELTDEIEFVYDTARITVPAGFNYFPREFDIEPFGYKAKTSFAHIHFNETFLRSIIDKILEQDSELVKLLKFKFYMHQKLLEKGHTAEAAPYVLKYDPKKIGEKSDDFRNFAQKSLLHTLAHMLYIYISTKVGVNPDKLSCRPQGLDIVILEDSKKDGMGIVETIQNKLEEKGTSKFFNEFSTQMKDFLETHSKKMDDLMTNIQKEDSSNIKELRGRVKTLTRFEKEINSLNDEIEEHVPLEYLDYSTYRYLLLNRVNINKNVSEYLLPLIHTQKALQLCYDGCNDCIILEKYCSDPFNQIYLLSRRLVEKFFEIFERGNVSFIERGVGMKIKPLATDSKELVIKTPFIDRFGVEFLTKLKSEGKEITLVTKKENSRWANKLRRLGIEVKFAKDFHDKVYYLKGNQLDLLITGSVNLQRKGFQKNEENISLTWDQRQIQEIMATVEGLEKSGDV